MASAIRRLAFLAGPLTFGGAEQQLYHLLSGLDRRKWDATVFSFDNRPDAYWVKPIEGLGVPVCHLPRDRGRLARVGQFVRHLKQRKVDAVHSTLLYLNPYAAVAGRLAGVPVIIGTVVEDAPGRPQLTSSRWLGYYGLDVLVANWSGALRNVPPRVRRRTRFRVVHNGVLPIDLPDAGTRADLRRSLGLKPETTVIGAIGRLDENKNTAYLIKAFAAARPQLPNAQLVIVGDGPERPRLESLIEELGLGGAAMLAGARPHAYRLCPVFDVCCITSYREGVPNVVMEALVSAVPVLSTNCGGVAEVLEDGATGHLIPHDDVPAFAGRLVALLSNAEHARQCGEAGRRRMLQEFSMERMVGRMTDMYEEVVTAR